MKARLPTTLGDLSIGAAKKCPKGLSLRRGYRTRRGVKVGPACVPAPEAGATGGWSKDLTEKDRREVLRRLSEKEGCRAAIRKMTLLRNITTDKETERRARGDAEWLAKQRFCRLKTKDRKQPGAGGGGP